MSEDKLAKYIVDDLFKWFADERKSQLEPQWRRNYDAFRGRYDSGNLKKWRGTEGNEWRSKVFVKYTKQKVMAGFTSVASVMLQSGKLPWSLTTSKAPDGMTPQLPEEELKARCERMKARITEDLEDARAAQHFLTSLLEGAIYGVNAMRGPVLRQRQVMGVNFGIPGPQMAYPDQLYSQYGRHTMQARTVEQVAFDCPSIWDTYWDLENDDPHQGQGAAVVDYMSRGKFTSLKSQPGYDKGAIDEVLSSFRNPSDREGNSGGDESDAPHRAAFSARKRVIPVIYFWGRVPKKYLSESAAGDKSGSGEDEVEVYCVCVKGLRGPRVIRPPVESVVPYRHVYIAKWQDLPHEASGVGIPEDVEDTQMIINGLVRGMLDNKALSTNLLTTFNPRMLAPGQNRSLYPGKSFEVHESVQDVRSAIEFFAPPDITGNTPELVRWFKEQGDEETGITKLLEGMPAKKNSTAFEANQLLESGNKLMGGIISNQDNGIIAPTILSLYHWRMACGDESLKGDFTPHARGYQSYKDKSVRGASLLSLLQFALSNKITSEYAKVGPQLAELAKIRDFDPEELWRTDEEVDERAMQRMAAMAPQPPTEGAMDGAL